MSEEEITRLQEGLVEELKKKGHIRTSQVEQAFKRVPRHFFLPGEPLDQVYSDRVIPIKRNEKGTWTSSSSQPAIMALMLEQLDLKPGQRVLEIGAGSGFNAALIAAIVGGEGSVVTVDIQPDLIEEARKHLDVAGFEEVKTIAGDGGDGYAPGSPYDRIILTVSSSMIPPAWREQLADGGRLVLPLDIGAGFQKSIAFERQDKTLVSKSIIDAGFMPLQGSFASAQAEIVQLGLDPNLYISSFHGFPVNGETLNAWFGMPQTDRPAGLKASIDELAIHFITWLTVHGIGWAQLNAVKDLVEKDSFPAIMGFGGENPSKSTFVLVNENGMAALRRPPGQDAPLADINDIDTYFSSVFDVYICPYGQDPDHKVVTILENLLRKWDQDGRPPSDKLQFCAIPADQDYELSQGEHVLKKPWTNFIIRYA